MRDKPADIRYVRQVPRTVPPGRIVVHNHVRPPGFPNIPLGFNGFRAWTEPEGTPERVRCECEWPPHLPEHYRVERSG
jgi:hypothetical protein